jgi:hypothetical protein
MSHHLITLAAEQEHDLPVPAEVIGVTIFVFFCILMSALLIFGKGRPHA